MRNLLLSLALSLTPTAASASGGADPFQFLLLDADARAVALGGAYTAAARDANALLYNPAWLGAVRRHHAVFMHNAHFAGTSQEYLALATRWGFGGMLNALDYGEIPRTTVSNPNGTLGTYGARDLAASAGYGRAWGPVHAGTAVKFVRESIDTAAAAAWAADLGLGWRPESEEDLGPALGLSVQNLGPRVRFQAASESLPATLRSGASYDLLVKGQRATLAADVAKTRADSPVFSLGAETVLVKTLSLRIGYSSRNQAGLGLSGGFGVALGDLSVDYAITPFGELGTGHRASIGFRFGGEGTEEPASWERRRPARPEMRNWPGRPDDGPPPVIRPPRKAPKKKAPTPKDPRKTPYRY